MIRRLHIQGLGPHVDTVVDFDPLGVTQVAGRSEAGKTTLEDAVCFVLWGQGRDGKPLHRGALHDDCDAVEVRMELASGSKLRRVLRWTDGGVRKTIRQRNEREHRTEKSWLGALGALGQRPALLRLALVPLAWQPLAQGEGGGRPLRDALAGLLPPVDRVEIVRELMAEQGHALKRGDATHESDAVDQRRRARAHRDRVGGQVQAGRATLAKGQAIEPASVDASGAHGVLEMADAWKRHDTARANWELRSSQALERMDQIAAWNRALAELGERPEGHDAAKVERAEQALAAALEQQRKLAADRGLIEGDLRRANHDLDRVRSNEWHPAQSFSDAVNAAIAKVTKTARDLESAPTHCPTCEQLWKAAKVHYLAEYEAAKAARAEADQAYEAEVGRRLAEREVALADAKTRVMDLEVNLEEAAAKVEAHAEVLKAAQAERDRLRDAARPAEDWERARRGLGDRPAEIECGDEPRRPAFDRPSADDVEAAEARVQAAAEAAGARAERDRLLAEGRKVLDQAERELEAAEAELARLEVLVAAVRAAPTEGLRRGARQVLGDLGPVELVFSDEGGVEVLVDGRPWHLASDGRLIVADVRLRAGIRRALGVPWLPLFIDRAQDVGGQPLPLPRPAIVLRTDDERMRSSAALVGAA